MSDVVDVTTTRTVEGTYVGDGLTGGKEIVLGYAPKRVEITSDDGNRIWIDIGESSSKLYFTNFSGAIKFGRHDSAITITSTGFIVDSDYTNKNGTIYTYKVVM